MKKIFIIFVIFVVSNAFAAYTEDIVGGCGESSIFYPIFQINTYTCANGYFLPADTLGCQPCPTGHVCNGGTFSYNATKAQGISLNNIIENNVAKGCSENLFNRPFIELFEPNTINITWNDKNGNITSTTCDYSGQLVLPSPPTRAGYVFSGWKLKQNAQP